jgi:hypothetical protein
VQYHFQCSEVRLRLREEPKPARAIVHLRRFHEHPPVPEPYERLEQAMRKRGGKRERLLEVIPRLVVETCGAGRDGGR